MSDQESFRVGLGLGLSAAASIARAHGAMTVADEIEKLERTHTKLDEYFGVAPRAVNPAAQKGESMPQETLAYQATPFPCTNTRPAGC